MAWNYKAYYFKNYDHSHTCLRLQMEKNLTKSWWRLRRSHAESPPSQHSVKFSRYKPCESGDLVFMWSCDLMLNTLSKGHVDLSVATSYSKSAHCLIWCPCIFCRWRYVFSLSLDLKTQLHQCVMHIYGCELLVVCHHLDKFCDHRHSDSYEEKWFIKNMNLKNWVDWINTKQQKM